MQPQDLFCNMSCGCTALWSSEAIVLLEFDCLTSKCQSKTVTYEAFALRSRGTDIKTVFFIVVFNARDISMSCRPEQLYPGIKKYFLKKEEEAQKKTVG